MIAARPSELTIAFFPMTRGFGWAALSSPLTAHDWGLHEISRNKNVVALQMIEALIDRLQPQTIVLEAFERRNSLRTERIARLCRGIVALANDRGIEFSIYTSADVKRAFATVGAKTRQEIAEAVARHLPSLRPRLPRKRRPWDSADRRMALFAAAALVLTHYRFEAEFFFDGLKEQS